MLFQILICSAVLNAYIYGHHSSTADSGSMVGIEKCFDDLGCIHTTDEWYNSLHRPHNLEPLSLHTIKTQFVMITRDNTAKPLNYETLSLRKGNLTAPSYRQDNGVIIFIHDFTSNGYTGWIKHIVVALLPKTNANLISVDWEAGAEPPFEQAIANARVVALQIIAAINSLKRSYKLQSERIHLIGHGVGAHIAGYVGNGTKIGKITALDPTGPFFADMPPIVRLDPLDAGYVEVLHTDASNGKSQGTQKSLGHADFYLNGAQLQPGCNKSSQYSVFTKIDRNTLKEGAILPGCSHKRAFKYYIESLEDTDCEFTAVGCSNYEKFSQGKCSCSASAGNISTCGTFGLFNSTGFRSTLNFYVNTRGEAPYCMNSYDIGFYFENNAKAKHQQEGNFELYMLDEGGVMVNASASYIGLSSQTHLFKAGNFNNLIYYASPPRMKKLLEVRLKWIHNPNSLCLGFCKTSVYVSKITVQLLSAVNPKCSEIQYLCPCHGKTKIDNGNFAVFNRCAPELMDDMAMKSNNRS